MRFSGKQLVSEACRCSSRRNLSHARLTRDRPRNQAWDTSASKKPASSSVRDSVEPGQDDKYVETPSWAQEAWPSATRRQRQSQRPWMELPRRSEGPRGRTVPVSSRQAPDGRLHNRTGKNKGRGQFVDEHSTIEAETKGTDTDNNRLMLVISGVSPNLMPSDFHRLAPRSLSAWNHGIKMVTQLRCPATLKPKGSYLVTFATAAAATAYSQKIQRLQAIARWKFDTPNGLWEATLPAHLHSRDGSSVAEQLSALTLATPSQPNVAIQRKRTSDRQISWQKQLQSQLDQAGHGTKPPTVILETMPGRIQQEALKQEIEADGARRDEPWDVGDPIWLPNTKPWISAEDHSKSRFAIVCETEWEARRFQRQWNGRTLACAAQKGDTATQRLACRVAVLNW